MRILILFLTLTFLPLTACVEQTLQQHVNVLTPNLARNIVKVDDFVLKMKWCSISQDRTAECEVEITSLYQDKKSGISYPTLQDNKGKELRMQRKDGSVSGQVMVAGQPYTHRIIAKNLPTYSTEIRSIVGTFVIWDLRGIKISEKPIVFSNIPVKSLNQVQTAPTKVEPVSSTPQKKSSLVNSYWHGKITPVVASGETEIMRLWKRGAYIHFREDGIAGYNWSEAKNYNYHNFNTWSQNGNTFTLTMSGAIYTFDLESETTALTAYLQQGGAFKMVMIRQR